MTHWLDELRDVDRPLRDRRDYARAARDMAHQGLTPRDIADALGITTNAVHELLAEPLPIMGKVST
jgi:DNA-binding transcriptional regulator LsrR (DeoR family)